MIGMSFKKLQVWEKGILLVKDVYQCTRAFPKDELYGLVSQMRRASISIPSNIAEGSQRTTEKDFAHFVLIAKGSLAELHTQVIIARELEYLTADQAVIFVQKIEELDRMIRSFHLKLTS